MPKPKPRRKPRSVLAWGLKDEQGNIVWVEPCVSKEFMRARRVTDKEKVVRVRIVEVKHG